MCDESIINFMVYSKGKIIFLKFVDASNMIKDHAYIYDLLKKVVAEVGKSNVVQIVTNNGSKFIKAEKNVDGALSFVLDSMCSTLY